MKDVFKFGTQAEQLRLKCEVYDADRYKTKLGVYSWRALDEIIFWSVKGVEGPICCKLANFGDNTMQAS